MITTTIPPGVPPAPPLPLDPDVADEYRRLRAFAQERMAALSLLWTEGRLDEPGQEECVRLRTFVRMSFGEWLIQSGRV